MHPTATPATRPDTTKPHTAAAGRTASALPGLPTIDPDVPRPGTGGEAGPPSDPIADPIADPAADPTAALRSAANALTMHALIHSGIAEQERAMHNDGAPNETFDEILARIASLAPRHQVVADAARDVAAALRAIVAAIDQVCTQPVDTPDHPDGSTDGQGNATTPPMGESVTVLYRDAHEQVRTAWAFLPEFHQIFNGLHLVGPERDPAR
jgi:hypothetical protein